MKLFHATTADKVDSILKKGLLTGQSPNWEGMNMRDALYFAFTPEVACDYCQTAESYNEEDVAVFSVDLKDLDEKEIGYDWNNRCEYYHDINSVAYFSNVEPNRLSLLSDDEIDNTPEQDINSYKGTLLYERVLRVFDEEVETNMEI